MVDRDDSGKMLKGADYLALLGEIESAIEDAKIEVKTSGIPTVVDVYTSEMIVYTKFLEQARQRNWWPRQHYAK